MAMNTVQLSKIIMPPCRPGAGGEGHRERPVPQIMSNGDKASHSRSASSPPAP